MKQVWEKQSKSRVLNPSLPYNRNSTVNRSNLQRWYQCKWCRSDYRWQWRNHSNSMDHWSNSKENSKAMTGDIRSSVVPAYLHMKRRHFQNKFHGKDGRKDNIQIIQRFGIILRLFIVLEQVVLRDGSDDHELRTYFHGQNHCIDHDQGEDGIFKWRRSDEPPDFRLNFLRRDVAFDRLRFQGEFDTFPLKIKDEHQSLSERGRWSPGNCCSGSVIIGCHQRISTI